MRLKLARRFCKGAGLQIKIWNANLVDHVALTQTYVSQNQAVIRRHLHQHAPIRVHTVGIKLPTTAHVLRRRRCDRRAAATALVVIGTWRPLHAIYEHLPEGGYQYGSVRVEYVHHKGIADSNLGYATALKVSYARTGNPVGKFWGRVQSFSTIIADGRRAPHFDGQIGDRLGKVDYHLLAVRCAALAAQFGHTLCTVGCAGKTAMTSDDTRPFIKLNVCGRRIAELGMPRVLTAPHVTECASDPVTACIDLSGDSRECRGNEKQNENNLDYRGKRAFHLGPPCETELCELH